MAVALRQEAAPTAAEIIKGLESRTRSDAALRLAVDHADEIAPVVIELAEKAARGIYLVPNQMRLLFWGIHVLAAARRTELCQPLIRLLRALPSADIERMLGLTTIETLSSVIVSVFDGEHDSLIEACADRNLDSDMRWSLIEALARLTFDGAVPRAATLEYLDRFEREPLASPGDDAWHAWQSAISLLGLEEMRERMRAAWRDGRLVQGESDLQDQENRLLLARNLAPGDASLFTREHLTTLDNPFEALFWVKTHEDPPPEKEGPFGTDPAAAIELVAHEIHWLEGFFSHSGSRGLLELIDGFYCGLIAGPGSVQAGEYITKVWEAPAEGYPSAAPRYDNPIQADYVTGLLRRHWNTIALRLHGRHPHVPLLQDTSGFPEGRLWALGFLYAVRLRIDAWEKRKGDRFIAASIIAFMSLAGRKQVLEQELSSRERSEILDRLPFAIEMIHAFWHGGRDPLLHPRLPKDLSVKIGRNAYCPCGSGKKYKRCCGASATSSS